MDGEAALEHIESKLDAHIQQHNDDYKKLLFWAAGIVLSMVGTLTTWFVTYGAIQEKVSNLEEAQKTLITRQEFDGLSALINEKFKNVNDKLDKISGALKI